MFRNVRAATVLALAASFCLARVAAAQESVTDDQFLDAAYQYCANVDNRDVRSCDCERKLIKDRVIPEDKAMAYWYWTDKEKFKTEYEKRSKADPAWQPGFSERFSNLGALITAACTVRAR